MYIRKNYMIISVNLVVVRRWVVSGIATTTRTLSWSWSLITTLSQELLYLMWCDAKFFIKIIRWHLTFTGTNGLTDGLTDWLRQAVQWSVALLSLSLAVCCTAQYHQVEAGTPTTTTFNIQHSQHSPAPSTRSPSPLKEESAVQCWVFHTLQLWYQNQWTKTKGKHLYICPGSAKQLIIYNLLRAISISTNKTMSIKETYSSPYSAEEQTPMQEDDSDSVNKQINPIER